MAFLAVICGALAVVATPAVANSGATPAAEVGSYSNAAIANRALTYVGQNGGAACTDAGGIDAADGQCRSFVNCVIWLASGGTQQTGSGWPDYFAGFESAGGQRISNVSDLAKGDVVQIGQTESDSHLH